MKKILLLSTGGTIASTSGEGGLTPTISGSQMLKLIPELDGLCEIYCKELFSMDSSNIQPEEWAAIAQAVFEALPLFDGIVITHGTDTMAYTAAALSFMLQNLNKPVILTGSQIPIEDSMTDGKRNLLDAFYTAADGRLSGVYLVFDHFIIRGVNARKTRSRSFHAFESINREPEGIIENGKLRFHIPPSAPAKTPPVLDTRFNPNVLLIKLVPGTNPNLIRAAADLGYKAVVIEAFGLGGIPGVRRDLLPAIRFLLDKKIPVIITTQCVHEGADLAIYDVGVCAGRTGALSSGAMTTEAVITKLMWILGQTSDFIQVCSLFFQDFLGEFNKK